MRGKHKFEKHETLQWRITPADAGKTVGHELTIDEIQDHPRGCGENLGTTAANFNLKGSPPRMRGKHTAGLWPKNSNRITPADAGKTDQISIRDMPS